MIRQVALCVMAVGMFAFGFFAVPDNRISERHAPDPRLQKKLARMKSGQARPGYPGEAMKWYIEQRAYPFESIPIDWKQRALEHIREHNLPPAGEATTIAWSEVGPGNIGGRTRSIAIHPTNPSIMYAGSVSGGVWKSTTSGSSWFPTDDFAANLAISSIVIDPSNPNIVYAGTGEGFFNADAIRGAGVLKSTNAGASWTLQTSFSGGSFPYYINDLYLRPDSTSILYAATNTGLFRTTNGGTSWSYFGAGATPRATQIVADPAAPRTLYIAFGNFSTDGIYKTTTAAPPYTKLTSGLPTTGYHRISLAIAPSNPSILYAVFNNSSNYQTLGIYRTTNGGSSWTQVTTPTDAISGATHLAGQGWYNNVAAVSPTDPNTVFVGGVNLYRSTNGGTNWTMVSNWYSGAGYPYVHADQHAIVFSGSTMWFGNDGGVFRSTNNGTSFTEHNNGYATIQFYSGAVHPTAETYYGGTQDNGTLRSGSLPNWTMVFGGDGGYTAVDYGTPLTVYTEYVYLNFQKSVNGGNTWTKSMNGIPTTSGQFDGTTDRCQFIAPFIMDPTNPEIIVAGTYRVFRTTNSAGNWTAISGDLTGDGTGSSGATITAIGLAKTSSAIIYIGTNGSGATASRVQVTTNTGTTWTNVTAAPLVNRVVKWIAVDPNNADRAWVTFSGFGTGHVFLTTNRGASWTNVSGNLPDIPVNVAAINPNNQNHVFIGTDLGVFETTNGGTAWTQQNSGMANVAVLDLDLRQDGYLFAATHGRGMFKSTTTIVDVPEDEPTVATGFRLHQNFPNPFNPTTSIKFDIPRLNSLGGQARTNTVEAGDLDSRTVSLKVYDLLGREVATLVDGEMPEGEHTLTFDASTMASGVYVYRLEAGGFVETRKMVLLR